MTTTKTDNISQAEVPSELDNLKARANMLGISYNANIGVAKLAAKIDLKLGSDEVNDATKHHNESNSKTHEKFYMTQTEYKADKRKRDKANAGRMIRVRITCMNPNKTSWQGEIVSVGSAKLGTYKKFIPFNSDQPWHMPVMMYQALKERKCSVFQTVQGARGEKIRKAKLINEFAMEVLPPLTKQELKDLAQRQAMAEGTSNE
jgi:hypothetical protein